MVINWCLGIRQHVLKGNNSHLWNPCLVNFSIPYSDMIFRHVRTITSDDYARAYPYNLEFCGSQRHFFSPVGRRLLGVRPLHFFHVTRAAKVLPFAPRGCALPPVMNSESVTHHSFSVTGAAPKLPSITPRSGISSFSVFRSTCSFWGSTWARKSGARLRGMWSLSAPRRV